MRPSMNIPQKEACDQRSHNCRAVAAEGDDFVQMLDLQAVVEGVANAVREVEKRNATQNEEIKANKRMSNKGGGGRVVWSLCPTKWKRKSLQKQMDRDKERGDNTAGAEEDPQERLKAKLRWFGFHLSSQEKPRDHATNN